MIASGRLSIRYFKKIKRKKIVSLYFFLGWLIFFAFNFLLFNCKKKEEITSKSLMIGKWEFDYYERRENKKIMNTQKEDMGAFLEFSEEGLYKGQSSTFFMYFILQGNYFHDTTWRGGTYQLINDGREIHFDKGIPEFNNYPALIFKVDKLTDHELEISISGYKELSYFGNILGARAIDGRKAINDSINGVSFGFPIGKWTGYLKGFAQKPLESDAYYKGFADGITSAYIYRVSYPKPGGVMADSTNFKKGFAAGYTIGYSEGLAAGESVDPRKIKEYSVKYYFKR